MFRTSKICRFGAMALALSLPGTALAGQKHPGYSRTMDDLRLARALLQRTNEAQTLNGQQDEVSLAIGNIEGAISEIDKESAGNGMKRDDSPRFDARMPWAERLSRSFRLLDKAKEDCAKERDNPGDIGLRAQVLDHIDQAQNRIRIAIETINFDYSARSMPTRDD
jgi:hypothetical protein